MGAPAARGPDRLRCAATFAAAAVERQLRRERQSGRDAIAYTFYRLAATQAFSGIVDFESSVGIGNPGHWQT
jgi:hypothetical protein